MCNNSRALCVIIRWIQIKPRIYNKINIPITNVINKVDNNVIHHKNIIDYTLVENLRNTDQKKVEHQVEVLCLCCG